VCAWLAGAADSGREPRPSGIPAGRTIRNPAAPVVEERQPGILPACSTQKAIHVGPELPAVDRRRPHRGCWDSPTTSIPQGQRHLDDPALTPAPRPWSVPWRGEAYANQHASILALSLLESECPQRTAERQSS